MNGIVSILIGVGLLAAGAYTLYRTYHARTQADESQGWASTLGSITESRLGVSTNEDRPDSYFPVVSYTYFAIGQPLTGRRISFGHTGENSAAEARETLKGYPVGKEVTVYYDPANPSDAVLERRGGSGITVWIVGVAFLVGGLYFVGVGLLRTMAG